MKIFFSVYLVIISFFLQAQEVTPPTARFTIEGKIKKPCGFSLAALDAFKTVSLDSVAIYNHLMEYKKTIRRVKGVLLKEVLSKIEIDISSPKLLSEFYITCIASDGYKVVYSWNEVFNSDTGNHAMIVTEANEKKGEALDDRIALLCPTDYATGRRYVRGLQKIIITRVQ